MGSRVVDFVDEAVLIRKETYENLSKEQLTRQLKNKFSV